MELIDWIEAIHFVHTLIISPILEVGLGWPLE